IKYDGYRILCMISDGRIRLVSRNGKDWTLKFVKIYESALHIPVKDAIIDGEIVAVDPRGRPNFQALQNILKGIGGGRLVYYAFDIPHCMGYDLTRTPLIERKDFLRRVLETCSVNGSHIRYADHIRGDGSTVFVHSCRLALEGIVSKQADSPYEQTRSRRWVKVKCFHRQEFVIGGFTEPGGSRTGFGALLLGHYDPSGNLVYSGKVGTGFNDKMLSVLAPRLTSMETDTPPLINPPAGYGTKRVHWVRPELVAEVEYSERTEQGILRHPSFKGLREDKDPKEVVREDPESPLPAGPAPKPSGATNRPLFPKGEPMENISSVSLSNPDRILYPEMGITKRVLAEYYSDVSPWMLPHVQRRPLTLVRCPEGWRAGCFFQKHPGDMAPKALRSIPVMGKDGLEYYSVADDAEGLTALVQMGALEIHIWGSREEKLEQPDTMIFDLDPDPSVHWEQMIAAACLLRDRLSDLGLESFLKTTGGKGLHVAVPLTPRGRWDEVKEFSRTVAGSIVRESPREYIATMSKAKRKGKIFIDYLRNGRGATFIAPYSTRAKRGAPISAPVGWGELGMDLRPDTYNIENIRKRLSSLAKDPWEGFYSVRQSITRKMKKKLGMSSQ
ncbi:MAG: DNA ligase D, partial [Syntrophobacteraceae bacterium]